ncbi:MAG: hypothetical protein ACT4QC_22295 [Planctomycetaceae bacterium]
MLRTISASLMCLGLVTLGVTITRGESDETRPLPEPGALAGVNEDFQVELFPFEEGTFDVVVNEGPGGGFEFRRPPGEGPPPGPPGRGGRARFTPPFGPQGISDPAAREGVEKVIRGLQEEAERLQKEGKGDEAERKRQSARTLEGLLRGQQSGFGQVRVLRGGQQFERRIDRPPFEEAQSPRLQDLKQQLVEAQLELVLASSAKSPEEQLAEKRKVVEKLQQAIVEARRQFDDHRGDAHPSGPPGHEPQGDRRGPERGPYKYEYHLNTRGVTDLPHRPGMPGRPLAMHMMRGGSPGQPPESPEIVELQRKVDALRQAARRLAEGGLEEQARSLTEQADASDKVLAAEIKKRREAQPEGMHRMMMIRGGPPHELHQALKDLQEQVQALRGDVRQLREMLEKK